MKKKQDASAEVLSKKEFADRNWKRLYEKVIFENVIDRKEIVYAMQLSNMADLAIIQLGKKL